MRRIRPFLALLALLAVVPATAGAAGNSNLLKVQKSYLEHTGTIPPCEFTTAQLNDARKHITRDVLQYSPDLGDAINTALEARAAGACDKKKKSDTGGSAPAATGGAGGSSSPGGTPAAGQAPAAGSAAPAATPAGAAPATSTPQPAPTVDPAPAVANDAIPAAATGSPIDGANDAPAPLLVLALMLGLLLALGALWWAARWMGFNPPWLQRWRHASHEAGWRASAAWSEFTDWVRLGR
jgi:cobalamin biosynthesis Mg chelatase CobN